MIVKNLAEVINRRDRAISHKVVLLTTMVYGVQTGKEQVRYIYNNDHFLCRERN